MRSLWPKGRTDRAFGMGSSTRFTFTEAMSNLFNGCNRISKQLAITNISSLRTSCFNPCQGICPSAAGRSSSFCTIPPSFQSLPGHLPFCGYVVFDYYTAHRQGFNPCQGICPSAAKWLGLIPLVFHVFQSLPGNLPFCGCRYEPPARGLDICFNPFQGICLSAASSK
jgi:hypothetical protein